MAPSSPGWLTAWAGLFQPVSGMGPVLSRGWGFGARAAPSKNTEPRKPKLKPERLGNCEARIEPDVNEHHGAFRPRIRDEFVTALGMVVHHEPCDCTSC